MTSFSANLGFLWANLRLPEAIISAKAAGFDAVECHWPYATPPSQVKAVLNATGLTMLGMNTKRGDVKAGDNGLSAIPKREDEAQNAITEALTYAQAIKANAVHVMAGYAEGQDAHKTFVQNLKFATERAKDLGITILIEPLNRHDAPGYFLQSTDQARTVIEDVAANNIKLMFDCYHVGRTEGDLITRLRDLFPIIGHIQFASVPDRKAPDQGEINYQAVFSEIQTLGWHKPLGAEYKPEGNTDASLQWLASYA